MKVFRGYSDIREALQKPVVTIGNFDGVHMGHRAIIEAAIDRARKISGTSVVFTFRPHPSVALQPTQDLTLINTYDEKLEILKQLGVDVVVEQPFSREFSEHSAERFFRDVLMKQIGATAIYVGYDFGFGKDRAGSLELLSGFCSTQGIELHIAKPLKVHDEVCSSSRIRHHLKSGDVKSANRLLGREFFYRGLVVRGHGRGHKIGFATANVHSESKVLVRQGVYASRAIYDGIVYGSVTNVGVQPTFSADGKLTIETHLFDFDKDIYGETLEVRFVSRLRDEKKFESVEVLVQQIKKDAEAAKAAL